MALLVSCSLRVPPPRRYVGAKVLAGCGFVYLYKGEQAEQEDEEMLWIRLFVEKVCYFYL
jgi:hypothetical protein